MTVLAHVTPLGHETIGDDHSRLKALLDNDFLVGAGWDWQTMVLSPPADHPTLGWPVCQVPGCEGMVEGSKGVCAACAVRMARSGSDDCPICARRPTRSASGSAPWVAPDLGNRDGDRCAPLTSTSRAPCLDAIAGVIAGAHHVRSFVYTAGHPTALS